MRASATSRISAHLSHAVQANHAAKSDDATPFALLLESVSPKSAAKNDKPSDSQDDGAQDDKAAPDNKAQTTASAAAPTPAKPAAKPANDTAAKADDTQADPASDPQPDAQAATDATVTPPQPVLPQPVAAQPQVAAAAPATDAASGATAPVGQASAKPQAPQPAPSSQDAATTPDQQAATKPADAKPADIKTPDIKNAARKPAPADVKAAKADATPAPDFKPDTPAPAAIDAAPAKAAAPAPVTPQGDLAIAAPAAPAHTGDAPVLTQHVQVTTAAQKPNLPALAVEIAAKTQGGAKQFDIRLDPPELGRVEVRLSIDATGKASAHLSADQPQTLELLQKDSSSLTRALRDAGLNVAQDGLNFSLRQQNQQPQSDSGAQRAPVRGGFVATASIEPTAAAVSYRSAADGRVDIRI